ncbi:MAG: TonB-dependent receptor [Campylobacteraceae bacterium]|jgi:outer membrane receptor for ferrienterochelin and colicins|nr:TonB-dependent receptor [Campylobacteraceae bacterium]
MKKIIMAMIASSILLNAQVILDEIKVTSATKSAQNIDGVSSSIIVITKDEIEKNGDETLGDILRDIPSLTLQPNAFPSASSKTKSTFSIRGVDGVLLLIDGKRLAGEVKNPYDIDRIPTSMIKRIEIIKGPSSSLYGSDAMGGVIDIITKQPTDKVSGSVGIRAEINQKGEGFKELYDADIRGKIDKFSYSFGASVLDGNGYKKSIVADTRVNNPSGAKIKPSTHPNPAISSNIKDYYDTKESQSEDATVTNFAARLEYELNENIKAGTDISYMHEKREGEYIGVFHPSNHMVGGNMVPVFNAPVNSNDKNKRLNVGVDLKALLFEDLSFDLRIYQSRYKKRNDTTAVFWQDLGYVSQEDSVSQGMNANVKVTSYEAFLQTTLFDSHFITFGGEFRDENRKATVFNQAGTFEKKTVDYKALYIQNEYSFDDELNFVFGVRYDDISNANGKATFKAGTNYKLDDTAIFRAIFSQGYRVPDIRELYISKQTATGLQLGSEVIRGVKTNSYDLDPESINAYEIGFGGRIEKVGYDVAFFYNDIDDKIEMVDKGAYFTFENIADAYTYGADVLLNYEITSQISANFIWSELKTKNKDTKKDLLLTPKRTVILGVDYTPILALLIKTNLRYVGKQDFEYTNSLIQNVRKTSDDAFYVDMSLNYKIKDFMFFGGVDNIFGEKLDKNFFVDNGRIFYAGIRYNF